MIEVYHTCLAVMDRQEDLEELRKMSFDAAFSEQVDLCGVGVIRLET